MRYVNGTNFMAANGYVVNGDWYPRVTKILEIKSRPALENFLREMGSFESAEMVKNKSAEEGSLVHNVIQKVAVGEATSIPKEVKPAVLAFQAFNEVRKLFFHPEFIERQVWSGRYRYAGTVDVLAEVDGKFGVLDIKTSAGFYPEYNLQTAAYIQALQEYEVQQALALPREIETRWILRIDQHRICQNCGARLREKGGRSKIRNGKSNGTPPCPEGEHEWGEVKGEVELREFPYHYSDIKAFNAAKTLWEWENNYWLRQIGYLR